MTITRREFGATIAATALAAALPVRYVFAQNAEIKLKYGTAFPADHPGSVRIKEAAEAIRKDTGGRVDLQVYPTSQLGSEPDMISQTRSGAHRLHVDRGHEPADAGADRRHQRRRLRVQGLCDRVGGDGRRPRQSRARARSPRSTCTRSTRCLDNGYRNITTSTQADQHARRSQGLQDPRARDPLWLSMFKTLGAVADRDPFRRALLGAADQGRRRPGESAGADPERQALRGAEVLLADRPHLGRPFHLRQRQEVPVAAEGSAGIARPGTLDAAALKEREDIARLNKDAEAQLDEGRRRLQHARHRSRSAPC